MYLLFDRIKSLVYLGAKFNNYIVLRIYDIEVSVLELYSSIIIHEKEIPYKALIFKEFYTSPIGLPELFKEIISLMYFS